MTGEARSLAEHAAKQAHPAEEDPLDIVNALSMALHTAGLELPELHVDGECTCGRMPGLARVELGSVTPEAALKLAEVIARGVAS